MNRTLTAAVALAAGLGMTALAQAQTNPTNNYETPGKPSATQQNAPSPSASPAMPTNANPNLRNSNAPGAPAPSPGTTQTNMPGTQQPGTMQGTTQSTQGEPRSMHRSEMRGKHRVSASQSDIGQVQQELKSQGLYNGRVDGRMGRETKNALSKFQQENGLHRTSTLDQQTMSKLNQNGTPAAQHPKVPTAR